MRLGTITGVNYQVFDHDIERDVVVKHFPGYIQTGSYDITSVDNVLTIQGTLVGTSNGALDSQMETLRAIHRSKRVVWLDATDQYPQLLELVRISKLSGPTFDSSKGPYSAIFTLQCETLLPWGTTHSNPFNTTGIYFRDISGTLLGNAVNPLDANCNFTSGNPGGSMAGSYFSWEFILDNQNPFNNPTLVNEGTSTTGWSVDNGTSTTFSINTRVYANSGVAIGSNPIPTSSLQLTGTSTGSGYLGASYDPGISFSAFDFIVLWVRADFGGNATGTIYVNAGQTGNYYIWTFTNMNAYEWYRLVLPIKDPTSTTGSPNLTNITYFAVDSIGANSASSNLWLNEMAIDTGNLIYLECHVPSNVSQQESGTAINFSTWNGSAYADISSEDVFANISSGNSFYFLNGFLSSAYYSAGNFPTLYAVGTIGNNAEGNGSGPGAGTITYSTTYGTMSRLGIALKIPPATSDSIGGNLPSDDLTGFQAINKVRIKMLIYISNEDTSYTI